MLKQTFHVEYLTGFIKMRKAIVNLAALSFLLPAAALADPITWELNGHRYELIRSAGITWTDARDAAEDRGGYLATITSQEENAFIVEYLLGSEDKSPYWLGGFQDDDASEPGGAWQWITGELWDWTNWAAGEPNNSTWNNEDALAFAFWGSATIGQWNDAPAGYRYGNGGYIVEYSAVPEPGTLALFGLGLLGIGLSQRRRRKA